MSNRPRTQRILEPIRKVSQRQTKILLAIEKYGLSDSKHLSLLTGLDKHNIEKPLRDLYHAGLIERLPNNQFNRDRLKDPQVYHTSHLGTDWLERHDLLPHRATWITAGGQASHNLKASLVLACTEAAATKAGLRFIPWEEILLDAPTKTKHMKSPYRFPVSEGLVPDAVFCLATPDDYRRIFFLEVDLSDHGTAAYKRKADHYRTLIFSGVYKEHLALQNTMAAVLTVTTTKSRRDTMIEHTQKQDPSYFKIMPEYGSFEIAPSPALSILEGWHWPAKPNTLYNLKEVV